MFLHSMFSCRYGIYLSSDRTVLQCSRFRDLEAHGVRSNIVHVNLAALDVVEDVGSAGDAELSHAIGLIVIPIGAVVSLSKEFGFVFNMKCWMEGMNVVSLMKSK